MLRIYEPFIRHHLDYCDIVALAILIGVMRGAFKQNRYQGYDYNPSKKDNGRIFL